MAKHLYPRGIASVVTRVWIPDSASATGGGKTGLTSASSGLVIAVIADNESVPTVYTVAAGNVETITTIGTYQAPTASKCRFKEVDATNLPGLYEIHLADARWAVASSRALQGMVFGASGAAPVPFEGQLGVFNFDAADFGGTDLASAADLAALNNLSQAQAQAASTAALASYDPPTQAEMDARTLPAASYATSTAQTTAQSSLTAIQTAIASLVASVWAGITTAAMNRVADVVLRRKMANVKASADGDAMAAADSLYGMTQQHRRASTAKNPGFLTVFDPDGVELEQIDLGTSVASRPVVEMGDIP